MALGEGSAHTRAALHNGELDTTDPGHLSLGCRQLFHTGVSVGYRLGQSWNIVASWDHISNANLCSRNLGLNTYGVKIGYRF